MFVAARFSLRARRVSVDSPLHRVPRELQVGLVLVGLAFLGERGSVPLLAWTDRILPISHVPLLLGLYFAGWVIQRRVAARHRPPVLLAASAVLAAAFSVPFLVLVSTWLVGYHRVLHARVARGWKLAFVVATYAAWIVACCVPLAPRLHAAHPLIGVWGYVFAVSFTFRIAWVFHQAELEGGPPAPLRDFLLYFLFAPFFVVLPYMFAIPRFDRFRAGLARLDPAIEASGLRLLAVSVLLAAGVHEAVARFSPKLALAGELRAGHLLTAVPLGLLYYPGQAVAEAVANAGILIGLVRLVGIDLPPSFDRPLASRSLLEWWRRWNVHFRDLLVALCWYPVTLRLRRRPYLGLWAGCVSVFLVGSVLFHWVAKHYFRYGTPWRLPVGIFWECVAMTVLVGLALTRETWRARRGITPPPAGPVRVAAQRLGTYALVFASVVLVGDGAQYVADVRPFERLQPALERARALASGGHLGDASAALATCLPALADLVDEEPLDPVRQSQLAFALALPSDAQDLRAADEHLALARAHLDPFAPRQLRWLAAAVAVVPTPQGGTPP